MSVSENLLTKVANKLGEPPSYAEGVKGSILTAAASSYGARPIDEEVTQPTGFDPTAAALFEAIVESAYLVAKADGVFDDVEQQAFRHVVLSACDGMVAETQMSALLADLQDQLDEDGVDKRIEMVSRTVQRADQAQEVLRIAALLAHVSGGISDQERSVLEKLAVGFQVATGALEQAIAEAEHALSE